MRVRYCIAEGAGEVLRLLGRYDEARRQLDGAFDLAPDALRKARIEAIQGHLAFNQGEVDRSKVVLESARFGWGYGCLELQRDCSSESCGKRSRRPCIACSPIGCIGSVRPARGTPAFGFLISTPFRACSRTRCGYFGRT